MREEIYAANDCAACWNMSAHPTKNEPMYEAGVIQLVVETMPNHEDSAIVQEHAMGVLWNMASKEKYRVAISEECGGITAISKVMESHPCVYPVQREGTGALFFISASVDKRVRKTLTTSNAIRSCFPFSGNTATFVPCLVRTIPLYRALRWCPLPLGNHGQ